MMDPGGWTLDAGTQTAWPYLAARQSFRDVAQKLGGKLSAHPLRVKGPDDVEVAIDMAYFGPPRARAVLVVSSGIHGVEGIFGSALQVQFARSALGQAEVLGPSGVLLIHALNPYGFAWLRRANEDNVDLNRNFLLPGETYGGASKRYAALDRLLNPSGCPPRLDPAFGIRLFGQLLRLGMPALKEAVAAGQYDYPAGLFYGGRGPSETLRILERVLPGMLGGAEEVLHLDLHTGLGPSGKCTLLAESGAGRPGLLDALTARSTGTSVQAMDARRGVAYAVRGGLGNWLGKRFQDRSYHFAGLETGTYSVLTVLAALRAENRAFHSCPEREHPAFWRAQRRLVEVFAPASGTWRRQALASGVEVLRLALSVVRGAATRWVWATKRA